MSFDISTLTPYLPMAGNLISTLASAIESAIAAHKAGDPAAALAALEAAIVDVGPSVDGLHGALVAVDAEVDAALAAKFPQTPPFDAVKASLATRAKEIADALSGAGPADPAVAAAMLKAGA